VNMGRTVFIMIILFIVIVGTVIVSVNHKQVNLSTGLSDDNDMKLAKFISNTYAHNTIKDIRSKFIDKANITLLFDPTAYKNEKEVLEIANSKAMVYIYTDSLPGVKMLNPNQEWGVMSIGIVNAAVCTTRTIYKRMPFSEFGLFANSFPNSYYGDGEVLDGPVYVNGVLGVGTAKKYNSWTRKYPEDAGPIFTDLVYVTQTVKYTPTDFGKYFKGYKGGDPILNHDVITMPSSNFDLGTSVINKAYQLSKNGTNYSYIFLRGNYLKLSTDANENSNDVIVKAADLKKNNANIIYNNNASNTVHVKGFINFPLTIATVGYLYADSSIVYQEVYKNNQFLQNCINGVFPPLNSANTNALGLMGHKGFIVNKNAEPSNYDVLITANIFTNGELTIVEGGLGQWKWDVYDKKLKDYIPRHFIVYGSRTQGSLQSATYNASNKHGLREVITYDRRFKEITPPGAPYTDKGARISYWDEKFGTIETKK